MHIGIDPGRSGAIAMMEDEFLISVVDMPVIAVKVGKTLRNRINPHALASLLAFRKIEHAYLEEVASQPGEGAVGAFAFGRGYGQIEGILAALGIPYTLVRPQKWKRALGLPADKGASRSRASQLWPGASEQFKRVKDDGRAEAALLALYGARVGVVA